MKLLKEFELLHDDLASVTEYTAVITISPSPGSFTPDLFTANCLGNGNVVELSTCLPGSVNLLSAIQRAQGLGSHTPANFTNPERILIVPTVVQTNRTQQFVFQSWIKTASQNTRTLLAGYASTSPQNDTIFVVQFRSEQFFVTFTARTGQNQTVIILLLNGQTLSDNNWHHLAVVVTPALVTVFIDGQKSGQSILEQLHSQFMTLDRVYFYTGTTKHQDSLQFSGYLWGTSISFTVPHKDIYSSLSCFTSCGETLSTNTSISGIELDISSYELTIKANDFEQLVSSLSELTYDNNALEPLNFDRRISIVVSDGMSAVNATVFVGIQLKNEHTARMSLDLKRIYYYVPPSSNPHSAILSPDALFRDDDTTQTDYLVKVDLTPPMSCDRIDYPVKVKLEQCNAPVPAVFNLLPNSQWGLATAQGVQPFFSSLLGYNFYGSGVFIPDMTVYDSILFTPTHFTFVFWIQFSTESTESTVVYIRNQTNHFLFHLRVNESAIKLNYSAATNTLFWNWSPTSDWTHVTFVVEKQQITMCINGYFCSSTQVISQAGNSLDVFRGLEVYVGAVPAANGLTYQDRFSGKITSMAIIPNHTLPFDTLNCIIACSEQVHIVNSRQLLGHLLDPLSAEMSLSSGFVALNGSLQVKEKLRQDKVQKILRHVAYINAHPYPLPGRRYVSYTVYDGSVALRSSQSQLIVLYHGYRNLQLLRLGTKTVTTDQLRAGVTPFSSAGISTDARSDKLDSLLVEVTSRPMLSSACLLSSNPNSCPTLFSVDKQLLDRTSGLQIIAAKPGKLILCGLGNVSLYQRMLRGITFQTANPAEVVASGSVIRLHVYISDMNGISSASKTLTLRVQGSVGSRRKRRTPTKSVIKSSVLKSQKQTKVMSTVDRVNVADQESPWKKSTHILHESNSYMILGTLIAVIFLLAVMITIYMEL